MAEVATEENLRALDPNLPLLASQAAIELDALLCNVGTEPRAIKKLALWLTSSFQGLPEGPEHNFLVDPPTESLLTRAFQQAQWAIPVRTVTDLSAEASKLANSLRDINADSDHNKMVVARAFCAALAESAALYLHSQYLQGPIHPFRR